MTTREQFIEAVLSCVGTPVAYMGRVIGPGGELDCAGVVLCSAASLGHVLHQEYYGLMPDTSVTLRNAQRNARQVESWQPGDFAIAMVLGEARHYVVNVGDEYMVHAPPFGGWVARERSASFAWRLSSFWQLNFIDG